MMSSRVTAKEFVPEVAKDYPRFAAATADQSVTTFPIDAGPGNGLASVIVFGPLIPEIVVMKLPALL